MTGFILLRVQAHRLLLTAALLAILLTTCVLTALVALSDSVGDNALRYTLARREAASTALVVTAGIPHERRDAAQAAVVRGARKTFGGLPTTVRRLERSGPYALPSALQDPAASSTYPDLTYVAALDRSRIELTAGTLPGPAPSAGRPLPVALPHGVAQELKLRPGSVLTLTDRLSDKPLTVRLTGLYRVVDRTDPYWQLDSLRGRGLSRLVFTAYGPLLADPSALSSGRVSDGDTGWLATADFRGVGTDRIGALRTAATRGVEELSEDPALAGSVTAHSGLATVLTRAERALLVSRSTLMIVGVQLVLLAAYALLLVSRLLSSERAAETQLLAARGASRRRIAALACAEALSLTLPAALCAPPASGPLVRLMTQGSVAGGPVPASHHVDPSRVWVTAALVAACCAMALLAPALVRSADVGRRGRSAALPAPVRAGADLGLLLLAAVALWQLERRTSGALTGDREGQLGIDPLLVAAPALALLAGTVLALRLLPPAARLAERVAARGRGVSAALAGWQFSRRLSRGAGPALLLVLAVAMGVLAIGQSASWERSQNDQADFRAGTSVRVVADQEISPGEAGRYAGLPGVRAAAPAHRASLELSGNRSATVLALDTTESEDQLLLRRDLARRPSGDLRKALLPQDASHPGAALPAGTRRLVLDLRIGRPGAASTAGFLPTVTVLLEDGYGLPYRIPAGEIPSDGAIHSLAVSLDEAASRIRTAPHGQMTLTGLVLSGRVPPGARGEQRLSVERLTAAGPGKAARPVPVPPGLRWAGSATTTVDGVAGKAATLRTAATAATPLSVVYAVGSSVPEDAPYPPPEDVEVRVGVVRTPAPPRIPGIATEGFLRATGARKGQSVDVTLAGARLRVTVVDTVRRLPTTAPPETATELPGEDDSRDGGALLLDLRTVNQVLVQRDGGGLPPNEWWLSTGPREAGKVAAILRGGPDVDPADVVVRDEVAHDLFDDPLGAGPGSALLVVALAAAALAAVGFATAAVGSQRERSAELAVLRALGTPRWQLVRAVAAEQGMLVGIALIVGLILGAALTRTLVPLIVLTSRATAPLPPVRVELPLPHVVLLLCAVAALPLLTVALVATRTADPSTKPRDQGVN
ncbi:ABC transporter permease [Streptomyces sp. AK02-01A]|uniref:ABC transporter permease n=1 Tax=Streptomyces sp. AK02-01A TaxID=3028648 RepID=UPI0029B73BDB|nr:ABC transporter permease [Streptomyces sp. AK02-01A]MDX3855216.1 ABC transporter permease [Streptomyces sp. AK02-01A]